MLTRIYSQARQTCYGEGSEELTLFVAHSAARHLPKFETAALEELSVHTERDISVVVRTYTASTRTEALSKKNNVRKCSWKKCRIGRTWVKGELTICEDMLEMMTIEPACCRLIQTLHRHENQPRLSAHHPKTTTHAPTACAQLKTPRTLTSKTVLKSSGVNSSAGLTIEIPELAISPESSPISFSI